jgi:hypothetical protein
VRGASPQLGRADGGADLFEYVEGGLVTWAVAQETVNNLAGSAPIMAGGFVAIIAIVVAIPYLIVYVKRAGREAVPR